VEQLLQIYWIDLTIPGINYNRSLLQSLTTLSAALTAAPETTVGIVMAPNCGPIGMEYTETGVWKSVGEVVTQLSDSDLNILYRDVTLVFDPTTILKPSLRPGRADAWMVVSALTSKDGQLRSLFKDSELWIRGVVVSIPMTPAKQWVNPLAAGSGSINPGSDFSPAQSRKQLLTGWKLAKAVLDALLTNLTVPDSGTSAHVMCGYDNSVAEAVLRMSSVLSVQVVTVCWADLDSDNRSVGHNERIAKWVIRSNKQVMKNMLSEKLFILDGYQKAQPQG
jgi:hypothetical protein